MTLDLPSTKLKDDQTWANNMFKLVNKGKQKQDKFVKAQMNKRRQKKPEPDSDRERLHDGVLSVSDTRTLADRLHEKLDDLKGQRGTGKKRKSPEEDEDMKHISIEKMKLKKKKNQNTKETQQKPTETTKPEKSNKKRRTETTEEQPPKQEKRNKDTNKQMTYYDEDGIEYPGDFYGSDDEGDLSLFDDNEIPDIVKQNNKKTNKNQNNNSNNNKTNKFNGPAQPESLSPEEEDNLQFGTFDFSTGKPVPMYLSNQGPRRKNLPKMLIKAEQLQLRLQDESEQGQKKAEQYKWDRMMKKAQGVKVRDNPILLAKQMANIKKRKKHSAIKWEARNAQVEKDKDIRFQKRQNNIKAKMDRKKMSALRRTIGASKAKTPKKSKGGGAGGGNKNRRPGFEGKKGSFINK